MLVPHLKRSVFSFLFHAELPFHFSNSVPSVKIADILEVVCRHLH
jgi:hypothetical protein